MEEVTSPDKRRYILRSLRRREDHHYAEDRNIFRAKYYGEIVLHYHSVVSRSRAAAASSIASARDIYDDDDDDASYDGSHPISDITDHYPTPNRPTSTNLIQELRDRLIEMDQRDITDGKEGRGKVSHPLRSRALPNSHWSDSDDNDEPVSIRVVPRLGADGLVNPSRHDVAAEIHDVQGVATLHHPENDTPSPQLDIHRASKSSLSQHKSMGRWTPSSEAPHASKTKRYRHVEDKEMNDARRRVSRGVHSTRAATSRNRTRSSPFHAKNDSRTGKKEPLPRSSSIGESVSQRGKALWDTLKSSVAARRAAARVRHKEKQRDAKRERRRREGEKREKERERRRLELEQQSRAVAAAAAAAEDEDEDEDEYSSSTSSDGGHGDRSLNSEDFASDDHHVNSDLHGGRSEGDAVRRRLTRRHQPSMEHADAHMQDHDDHDAYASDGYDSEEDTLAGSVSGYQDASHSNSHNKDSYSRGERYGRHDGGKQPGKSARKISRGVRPASQSSSIGESVSQRGKALWDTLKSSVAARRAAARVRHKEKQRDAKRERRRREGEKREKERERRRLELEQQSRAVAAAAAAAEDEYSSSTSVSRTDEYAEHLQSGTSLHHHDGSQHKNDRQPDHKKSLGSGDLNKSTKEDKQKQVMPSLTRSMSKRGKLLWNQLTSGIVTSKNEADAASSSITGAHADMTEESGAKMNIDRNKRLRPVSPLSMSSRDAETVHWGGKKEKINGLEKRNAEKGDQDTQRYEECSRFREQRESRSKTANPASGRNISNISSPALQRRGRDTKSDSGRYQECQGEANSATKPVDASRDLPHGHNQRKIRGGSDNVFSDSELSVGGLLGENQPETATTQDSRDFLSWHQQMIQRSKRSAAHSMSQRNFSSSDEDSDAALSRSITVKIRDKKRCRSDKKNRTTQTPPQIIIPNSGMSTPIRAGTRAAWSRLLSSINSIPFVDHNSPHNSAHTSPSPSHLSDPTLRCPPNRWTQRAIDEDRLPETVVENLLGSGRSPFVKRRKEDPVGGAGMYRSEVNTFSRPDNTRGEKEADRVVTTAADTKSCSSPTPKLNTDIYPDEDTHASGDVNPYVINEKKLGLTIDFKCKLTPPSTGRRYRFTEEQGICVMKRNHSESALERQVSQEFCGQYCHDDIEMTRAQRNDDFVKSVATIKSSRSSPSIRVLHLCDSVFQSDDDDTSASDSALSASFSHIHQYASTDSSDIDDVVILSNRSCPPPAEHGSTDNVMFHESFSRSHGKNTHASSTHIEGDDTLRKLNEMDAQLREVRRDVDDMKHTVSLVEQAISPQREASVQYEKMRQQTDDMESSQSTNRMYDGYCCDVSQSMLSPSQPKSPCQTHSFSEWYTEPYRHHIPSNGTAEITGRGNDESPMKRRDKKYTNMHTLSSSAKDRSNFTML